MRTRFYELCWFFLLGYFTYSLMEILFRGYTHWTMAVTGGITAAALYLLHRSAPAHTLLLQCLCGALLITAIEFSVGVIDNLVMGWSVWGGMLLPGGTPPVPRHLIRFALLLQFFDFLRLL